MSMSTHPLTWLVSVLMLAGLTACDSSPAGDGNAAGSGPSASSEAQAEPSDTPVRRNVRLERVPFDLGGTPFAGEVLLLTTFGSSSCPWTVTDVVALPSQSVRITVTPGGEHQRISSQGNSRRRMMICTADMSRQTTQVRLPDGLNASDIATALVSFDDGGTVKVSVTDSLG